MYLREGVLGPTIKVQGHGAMCVLSLLAVTRVRPIYPCEFAQHAYLVSAACSGCDANIVGGPTPDFAYSVGPILPAPSSSPPPLQVVKAGTRAHEAALSTLSCIQVLSIHCFWMRLYTQTQTNPNVYSSLLTASPHTRTNTRPISQKQKPANGGANPPGGARGGGGTDTTGMSAAQIAKIEAKRAAKAAKAAAKGAAKKEKKKAAGLGVGTAELRQLVAPAGAADAPAVGAEEIAAKLDPFRTGEVREGYLDRIFLYRGSFVAAEK